MFLAEVLWLERRSLRKCLLQSLRKSIALHRKRCGTASAVCSARGKLILGPMGISNGNKVIRLFEKNPA